MKANAITLDRLNGAKYTSMALATNVILMMHEEMATAQDFEDFLFAEEFNGEVAPIDIEVEADWDNSGKNTLTCDGVITGQQGPYLVAVHYWGTRKVSPATRTDDEYIDSDDINWELLSSAKLDEDGHPMPWSCAEEEEAVENAINLTVI